MKAKLKMADSLTPTNVREIMKPFNNKIIEVDEDAIAKKLNRDYIAFKTELREDGYPIFQIHHVSDRPEF